MQKLSRLFDSTPFRRGRPQDAAQLEESDGSEAAADADEAVVAADENEFIDSEDEFSLDEEEADAAQRKLGLEDPDEAELYGGPDNIPEDEQLSLDESGSDFDGGSGGGGVFGEAIDEAASAAASAAWESRDRQPLLAAAAAAAAAESDTSGDIDLEDGEEDEEDEEGREFAVGRLGGGFSGGFDGGFSGGPGAGFRGGLGGGFSANSGGGFSGGPGGGFSGPGGGFSGPGGVFNQGFVDDEIGQMEAAAGWGEDEEQFGGDDGEVDEDGQRHQEDEDEEYYEDEDEDFEDDEEDEDDVCFGADAISAGAGTSLTEAQVQRPMPKIVGFLEAEMKHEAKSQSLNVRIVQVELKMALTKFRRKSNKKMRWSMLQVCATLLPDKALTFRTPMVDHEDPKKKKLLTLKAAADSAEAGAAGDKEGEAEKGKDGGQNKDKKSGKKGKKDKKKEEGAAKAAPKEAAKSGDSAKPVVKIGKLSIPKLAGKSKAKEEAAVGAAAERNSKKSVLAGIAARKAAQQQQQQERREQHRQQQLAMRERQKQERLKQKQAAAAGKPIDEPLQDVTKFAKLETEQKAAKKADLKQPQEEEDKEIFKFVPISKEKNLEKNPQQPLAIRFRLYGCWRKKRSFLLGENTFALEKMAEAVHTSDKVKQNRFRLQLEERRFAISKLKHLSDSDEELEQQKASAKAQKKAAKDSVDALLLPPPTEGPALVSQPELFLGLAYNQVNGHLQVAIVKACNLRNPKSDKPPTAYTKVHLMWGLSHNNSVLFRSKTLAISDCPNPEWHETFEYPVSRSHLDDVSVMVKVYCKHTLNRTVTIGWCSIGRNNCSEEALDHWSDMRSSNGEQICNWHVLLKVSKEKTEGQLDSD